MMQLVPFSEVEVDGHFIDPETEGRFRKESSATARDIHSGWSCYFNDGDMVEPTEDIVELSK